ncbi:MAG: DUF7309 domain-containing protein, partial [Turicibacter sp.]
MGGPTDHELRQLYEAAIAFRNLKPWEWMYASQVFIVKDKETGIDGFCSVMGMMGEHYSFSLYLGEEGYRSYRYLYDKSSLCYMDHLFLKGEVRRNCLTVSFENIEDTTEVDREEAKALGYAFTGANQCPRFRRHKPGIYSWYIEEGWQCRFLTEALLQAILIVRLAKQGSIVITDLEHKSYYMRYYFEEGWKSRYVDSNTYRTQYQPPKINFENNILAYRVKKLAKLFITLEAVQFYLPNPVMLEEGSQPFFMLITALVDSQEGQLFFLDIQETPTMNTNMVLTALAKQLIEIGVRPEKILAEDADIYALLEDFCKQIDVDLIQDDKVKSGYEFAEYIYEELDVKISDSKSLKESDDDIDRLIFFTDQIFELFVSQGTISDLSEAAQTNYKLVIQT